MKLNGETFNDYDGFPIGHILVSRGLPRRGIAVAINGVIVPRSQWDDVVVGSNDAVEIVTAAAGG